MDKNKIEGFMKTTIEQRELFKDYSSKSGSKRWQNSISRMDTMPPKPDEIRTEFSRDTNRILHSMAYRRLKHKTQVFFNTSDDHICTRIEHVNHVSSISNTIASFMGLNSELVSAIALGHDLGHAPFGHEGEVILKNIMSENNLSATFWHEGNSLRFIDKIETLPDFNGYETNMNLTYAVRDGIVCHCGEVDENGLKPRDKFIDLETIQKASEYNAYTYEGCVVKISDKIAYLGRDIEDALKYKILTGTQTDELESIIQNIFPNTRLSDINTSALIHELIIDLCKNSNPENGLTFSHQYFEIIKAVKDFNYKNIYRHPKLDPFRAQAKLALNTIFYVLNSYYAAEKTITSMQADKRYYPQLIECFESWLIKYSNIDEEQRAHLKYNNKIVYDISNERDYQQAIIDYISGMTDNFALKVYGEIAYLKV